MGDRLEILDFCFRQNEYLKEVKKPKRIMNSEGLIKFKYLESQDGSDFLTDILDLLGVYLIEKAKPRISLFFGLEDFIGFSSYQDVKELDNKKIKGFDLKLLGEQTFVILSERSTIFYLSSEKSLKLIKSLNPFFLIIDREKDFSWIEDIKKKLKIENLFLPKTLNFSPIEIEWLKKNFKKILVDTSNNKELKKLESVGEVISFNSNETNNYYIKFV